MVNFSLQNGVGIEPNRKAIIFFLKQSIQRRIGKGGIAAKELRDVDRSITGSNTRRQNFAL